MPQEGKDIDFSTSPRAKTKTQSSGGGELDFSTSPRDAKKKYRNPIKSAIGGIWRGGRSVCNAVRNLWLSRSKFTASVTITIGWLYVRVGSFTIGFYKP